MIGCRINGSPDPPAIEQAPWWPITLVFKTARPGGHSPSDLYHRLIETIPSFKTPDHLVVFKLHSLRVWRQQEPILLKVNSLFSRRMYQMLRDIPTVRNYAHVGWSYSSAEREISFVGSDHQWLFQTFCDVDTPYPLLLYVKCSIKLIVNEVEYSTPRKALE